jgi:hypothetical protein
VLSATQQAICHLRIDLGHQDGGVTGGIEAEAPATVFVDGKGALVIASMQVTDGA